MTRWAHVLFGISLALPTVLGAQQTPPPPARPVPTVGITLSEALEQARRNSPAYRQVVNDAGPARWAVRNAYASLLPSFDVGTSFAYVGSGQSTFWA